jgi:hypothetical protein
MRTTGKTRRRAGATGRPRKTRADRGAIDCYATKRCRYPYAPSVSAGARFRLTPVVEGLHTTKVFGAPIVAFLRRRGNAYYLVHNVRRGGKVKQLHLARLGERPRITDEVMRSVRRRHPLLELNWARLRQQINNRPELLVSDADALNRLARNLHKINLQLADLAPQWLGVGAGPELAGELVARLQLLRSTVEIKLRQFDQAPLVPGSKRSFRTGG